MIWVNSEYGNGYSKCGTCGASCAYRDKPQHDAFHKTFSNRIGEDMSRVSWCDYGNHPFKRGAEGSASFQGTEYDKDGRPETVDMDACPDHNPMNIQRQAASYSISPKAYQEVTGVHPFE